MKSSSVFFASLFGFIGAFCTYAALNGASHQWFLAAICGVMVIALAADIAAKSEVKK